MTKNNCTDETCMAAPGYGACIASNLVFECDFRVGYMYREEPDSDIDSGWRFMSGRETQEYTRSADNFAMYDVDSVAQFDPDIVALLDSPRGSAFARDPSGAFVSVPFPGSYELN